MNDGYVPSPWVEKYRPGTIEECALPDSLIKTAEGIIESGDIPNCIFAGPSGTGKTTLARVLCNALDREVLFINASEDSGIDTIRNKVRNFASTSSLHSGTKVVILDEAEYLQANSTQPALRAFIEEFAGNCRFILTCNHVNRIIPALQSRCMVIKFSSTDSERLDVSGMFLKRVLGILDKEGIEHEPSAVAKLVKKTYPDFRNCLNVLQHYARTHGRIDEGIMDSGLDVNYDDLIASCKKKDFEGMRKWVAQNMDNNTTNMYSDMYRNLLDHIEPKTRPQAVVLLADYQKFDSFVADKELHIASCLTEIIAECRFV